MRPEDCTTDQSTFVPLIDGMFYLLDLDFDRPLSMTDRVPAPTTELAARNGRGEVDIFLSKYADDYDDFLLYIPPFGRGNREALDIKRGGVYAVDEFQFAAVGPLMVTDLDAVQYMYATPHGGDIRGLIYCSESHEGDSELHVTLSLWLDGSEVYDSTRSPRQRR